MEISSGYGRMNVGRSGDLGTGVRSQRRRLGSAVLLAGLIAIAAASAPSALAESLFPVVTHQPVNVVVAEGHPASFESTASGYPTVTVQWETSGDGGKTWKNVAKATATVLTIAKPKNTENGTQYRAHFKNPFGETTSDAATMTVSEPPVITKQPASTTAKEGSAVVFESGASGFPAPTVQWEVSMDGGATWQAAPFGTSNTLLLTGVTRSQNGAQYRARYINASGAAVSNAAILTVQAVAVVTQQPEDTLALAGEDASFEAKAEHGFPTPTVQWQVSSDGGSTWSAVPGATSDLLTISPALIGESGREYRAAYTNPAGTAYSQAATLFVSATDYVGLGWGMNTHGQTGVGSNESVIATPLPIKSLSFITAVSGGMRHSLALRADGTVYAWGFDSHGQLGNEGAVSTRSPILVEKLKRVTAVAAGGSHSLALLSNGTVMAWGDNENGQLGNGKSLDSEVPIPVEGLSGVTAIAAGEEHSLALLSNGTVMAWGNGERGQLGAGGRTSHNSPVAVKGLSGVKAIAAGGQFSMALLTNGTVVAWGDDEHGQLGSQAFLDEATEAREEEGVFSASPIAVEGLTGVRQIAAGRTHALALLTGGTADAWGNDAEGELGNGAIAPQGNTPVPVTGLSGATQISAGDQESVALLSSGSIEAWGGNGSGELGLGITGAPSTVPVEVHNIGGAAGISAGASHMLAFGATLPSVSSLSPSSGPVAGGTSVTITGSDIGGATAVHFGSAAATGVVVNSSSSVTAVAPAGTGTVNVTVSTPSGTSPVSAGDRYTYHQPPTVIKLSAKGGPATGGATVTITGTELTGATEVDFGTVATTNFTVNAASLITVTVPANAGGTVDVRVITPSGTSVPSANDRYKYAPTVEGVSPANGPAVGGTAVTVTGAGFVPGMTGTTFRFGKGRATMVECASTTSCTMLAPAAKTLGMVDVVATSNKTKSAVASGDHFSYE